MPEQFDAAALTDLAGEQLGVAPSTLRCRPISTGKHNSSYWIDSNTGRYVLRLAPADDAGFLFYERRMMRQEPELHSLIREHTQLPVAEVVAYDWSRSRVDRDYLLMTALPGAPLSQATADPPEHRARTLRQTGRHLRALHTLTAMECLGRDEFGYLGAHRPMQPQGNWQAAFGVMWNMLLDDVAACGCYSDAEANALRRLFERHAEHFGHPVTPRLLHMDVWGQNILVDRQGNVTGLVDFDRALWGDVEIEFAVLDYCSISEPSFWEGYGRPRDNSPAAIIRRRFYLLYEIQKYMPISVWRRHDRAGALRYKQHCLALAAEFAE